MTILHTQFMVLIKADFGLKHADTDDPDSPVNLPSCWWTWLLARIMRICCFYHRIRRPTTTADDKNTDRTTACTLTPHTFLYRKKFSNHNVCIEFEKKSFCYSKSDDKKPTIDIGFFGVWVRNCHSSFPVTNDLDILLEHHPPSWWSWLLARVMWIFTNTCASFRW